jgi:hypothetical protein
LTLNVLGNAQPLRQLNQLLSILRLRADESQPQPGDPLYQQRYGAYSNIQSITRSKGPGIDEGEIFAGGLGIVVLIPVE